ncbi:MAG TPA: hypothetical protein VFR99_06560 [Marmoricola sp.]|nr:hypothetical protein [Marmoricola sp.]
MRRSAPAADADVEAWVDYAQRMGYQDVDGMNRSQIRTLLGVAHPGQNGAS